MSNRPSTNFNTGSKLPLKPLTPLILIKQQKTGITHDTTNPRRRQTLITGDKTSPTDRGYFPFYSRAINPTMLMALSIITMEQTQGTQTTKEKAEHFLTYAATHPNTTIKFYKSDMILKIHSDASYLSE